MERGERGERFRWLRLWGWGEMEGREKRADETGVCEGATDVM